MSNLVLWSGLVGGILPMLIAVIQQATWPQGVKSLVSVLAVAAASAATAAIQTDFTQRHWETAALTMFLVTMTAYEHFWKPMGVAPAIEASTTFRRRKPT